MEQVINVKKQVSHINNEISHILKSSFGNDEAIKQVFESISDAVGSIEETVESMQADYSQKVDELEDELYSLDQKIEELEAEGAAVGFSITSEYSFNSMAGKMALFADNLADDSVLHLFSILAANIRSMDLHSDLLGVLSKYPELVKRLSLDHFLIT
jgi:enoyl-[acyl-carrier-protein] reductase (NADH)